MKLENPPKEKHLVLYVYIRINDDFNAKCINGSINKTKEHSLQQNNNNLQGSDNLQNIL